MSEGEPERTSPAHVRLFGVLFLFAFAARSIGSPTVFSSIGVQLPYAGDAYYHLRRIWYSVARFPESLDFDRYVSFPDGSQSIWPPAFDWTIALFIRPFVDPTDQHAVEVLASWAPVVLGATTTGVAGLLAARLYGTLAGWSAGCLYAVLPMSFIFSQLGMIDHHVAVAALSTVTLWIGCGIFARDERAESWAGALSTPNARWSAALGLAMGASLLTWPGVLIHIGVLQLALGLRWLWASDLETARARAIHFAISQAVVFGCIAPVGLGRDWSEFGSWSPLVLSNFQPAFFAMTAVAVCISQGLAERFDLAESRGHRSTLAMIIAAIVAAGALSFLPDLRESLVSASGWFTRDEVLLGLANEMQPILATRGVFDPSFAVTRFGAGFVVLPLVWGVLAFRAWKTRDSAQGLLLFWTFAFTILTLRQWRFGNTLAVGYAIMIGALLASWMPDLRRRLSQAPLRPAAEILVAVCLIVWSGVAFARFYQPIVAMNWQALSDETTRDRGPLAPTRRIYDQAGRWLARHTPVTSGYLDTEAIPEYGVLADWGTGHVLRYRSERPMIQDPFGPYAGRKSFEAAWSYYATSDEDAAIEILETLGARFIVGGRSGAGSTSSLEPEAMANRLWRAYGSSMPMRGGTAVPGLARHRLVYFAHARLPDDLPASLRAGLRPESIGVWEVVPGARIEGRAQAGSRVRLALDLSTSPTTKHVYRRETIADDKGRYDFVVPYPNDEAFSPNIRAAGAYRLSGVKSRTRLAVREEEIQAGTIVIAPDL